jgi:2-polyprenyl-3-methyl-5-hydroxy-6-metoxy-1,4-benzoquinol methylase
MKPNSYLFMSTMDKSLVSLLTVKVIGEYVLNLVPRGTHEWEKFIDPKELNTIF